MAAAATRRTVSYFLNIFECFENVGKLFVYVQSVFDISIADLLAVAYHVIFFHCNSLLSLFFFAELIFAYAAKGAFKILGQVLKLRAGGNTALRITQFLVINPTAYVTNMLHKLTSLPN